MNKLGMEDDQIESIWSSSILICSFISLHWVKKTKTKKIRQVFATDLQHESHMSNRRYSAENPLCHAITVESKRSCANKGQTSAVPPRSHFTATVHMFTTQKSVAAAHKMNHSLHSNEWFHLHYCPKGT